MQLKPTELLLDALQGGLELKCDERTILSQPTMIMLFDHPINDYDYYACTCTVASDCDMLCGRVN